MYQFYTYIPYICDLITFHAGRPAEWQMDRAWGHTTFHAKRVPSHLIPCQRAFDFSRFFVQWRKY